MTWNVGKICRSVKWVWRLHLLTVDILGATIQLEFTVSGYIVFDGMVVVRSKYTLIYLLFSGSLAAPMPTCEFPRPPTYGAWGLPLKRLSPHQSTAVRLVKFCHPPWLSVSTSWAVINAKPFLCNSCATSSWFSHHQTIVASLNPQYWPINAVIAGPRGKTYHLK